MSVQNPLILDQGGALLLDQTGNLLLDAPPILPSHFWRIVILDNNGHLVDIPQDDIESWQITSALNGGSGSGNVQFVRDFNKAGALGYGYQVLIWFWAEGQQIPLDPYYSGTIIDELDQEQLEARGRITISLKGDMSLLDAAVVDSTVTGGIGGPTPMPDAAAYLGVMIPNYQPPGFLAPNLPGAMFQLEPVQFTGTSLGQAIDTITKMSTDSGLLWTWFVKTNRFGKRQVVVQIDQNPNAVPGATFAYEFPGITCDGYKIQTVYRGLINVVSIYGGTDPTTGLQVFEVVENGDSVTAFGPWEQRLSVPWLISNSAAIAYGEQYTTVNGSPQAQGQARLLNPDPSITPGKWVQYNEAPKTSTTSASIKQVRVTSVTVQCNKNRIEQTLQTTSPIPYLDKAIYNLGLNIANNASAAIKPLSQNFQTLYIRAGGLVVASATNPAKITISACEAIFPTAGIVDVAALASTTVADSGTGHTGDGDYTVWVTSAGAFTISFGTPSASTSSQQLAYIAVVGGVALVTDARTFIAQQALDQTVNLALSGSASLGTPTNIGAGAYDQPLTFTLTSTGTLANASLSKLQLGWRQNGVSSIQIAPAGTEISPNASGSYAGTVPGIGAGATVDIYVRGLDPWDRPTAWLFVATTTAQNINLQPSTLFPNGTLATGSFGTLGSAVQTLTTFTFTAPSQGTYTVQGSLSGSASITPTGSPTLIMTLQPTAGSFSSLVNNPSVGTSTAPTANPATCTFTVAAGVTITMTIAIVVTVAGATATTVNYSQLQWLMQLIRTGN